MYDKDKTTDYTAVSKSKIKFNEEKQNKEIK